MDEETRDATQNSEETQAQYDAPQEGDVYTLQDPEEEIARLKAQVEEFKDKYVRAYAEIENIKKRAARDKQEIIKYGAEKLLREFLFVYDAIEKSLHTAMGQGPEDAPLVQGLRMTEKLFLETLKKHLVEPIDERTQLLTEFP
jgi:molecular chaperone GrpE